MDSSDPDMFYTHIKSTNIDVEPDTLVTGDNTVDLLRPNFNGYFRIPADVDEVTINMTLLASTLTSITVHTIDPSNAGILMKVKSKQYPDVREFNVSGILGNI